MSRDVIATINTNALAHNLARLSQLAPNAAVWAMIKSNAYGHGLLRVAKQLNSVEAFGVACIEEAVILREAGVAKPIVVMSGFLDQQELAIYREHRLGAVLHERNQIHLLEQAVKPFNLPLWLKIDTGMHRLGFTPRQTMGIYERLKALNLTANLGVMTHLACADSDPQFTQQQITDFNKVTQAIPQPKSVTNSAGIFNFQQAQHDWVRPGIMLYGVSPFSDRTGAELGLQPVMTFSAKLIAKKTVAKGDSIGYGATWRCQQDTLMGVVAVGYGDGYPRHAENGTPTLVGGQVCPLIGRVSMDMITIDLTHQPEAAIGEQVVLWGNALPVETVAKHAATIPYELLCGVTRRVMFKEKAV